MGRKKAAKAQQAAEDAWSALVSTWEAAGDRTGGLVDDARERVGSVTDEAWRRATAAYEALAGRRTRRPWGLILAAVAAGAAVGWVAAAAIGRGAGTPALEEADEADVETTSTL